MVLYRRIIQKGGMYFFTVTLKNRKNFLLVQHQALLLDAIKQTKNKYPFKIIAFVIMPEHLHFIWELPENDAAYSTRWQLIKSLFTRKLQEHGLKVRFNARNESEIWARRYWEHTIRDHYDLEKHIDYIHYNPVKHGFVVVPSRWPYSSIHGYIKKGIIPANWGAGGFIEDPRFDFGE